MPIELFTEDLEFLTKKIEEISGKQKLSLQAMLTAGIDPEVQNNIRTYEDIYSLLMSHPNAKLTFDEFVQLKPELRRELVDQPLSYIKLMQDGITLHQLFAFDSETRSHMLEEVKQKVTKKSNSSQNFLESVFSEDPKDPEEMEVYEIISVTVDEAGQLANSDLIRLPKNQLNQDNVMTHVSWDASVTGKFRVMQEYWDSFNTEFQDNIKKRLKLENIQLELVSKVNWKRHEHAEPNWFFDIVQEMHHLYDFEKIQQIYRATQENEKIIARAESSYNYAEIIKIPTAYKSKLASATVQFLLWDQSCGDSNQRRHKKLQLLLEDYDLLKLAEYIEKKLPEKEGPFAEGQFFVKLGTCSPKDSVLINENDSGALGPRFAQEIVQLLITSKRCLNREFEKKGNEDLNLIVQAFNPDIRAYNRQDEWRLFIWNSRIVAVTQQIWHEVFDDNKKDAIRVERLAKTLQQFNEKSENFVIAAGSADVYFDPNKSFSLSNFSSEELGLLKAIKWESCPGYNKKIKELFDKILSLNENKEYKKAEFDSEEFEFLVELLNKNNLAELSKKIVQGRLYIIEFNEAEISASGLTSYERDDALLHGKIPNFEIRLLKNKFMLAPEKIREEVEEIGENLNTATPRNYLAEVKVLEKELENIPKEAIGKFNEQLDALVDAAWDGDSNVAIQVDKIAEEIRIRIEKMGPLQSDPIPWSENSSTLFAQNTGGNPGNTAVDSGIQIDQNMRRLGGSPR